MKTIWKYFLEIVDMPNLNMPQGAEVVSVQPQAISDDATGIALWAIVDPEAKTEERRFRIFGTGHPIPSEFRGKFIGTVQLGQLVFHVFEVMA